MSDNPSVRAGTVGGTIVVVADEITSPYTGDTAQAQGIKILDGVANSTTPAHVTSSGMLSTFVGNNGTVSVSGTPNVHVTNSGTVSVTGSVDTELPSAAALADNTANPTVPGVGAFSHVWDGATWDRAPGNSSAGALVHQTNQGTVSVSNTVTVTANGGTILGQAGTVTALQGSNPWVTHQSNNGTVSVTGAVDTELPGAASLADNTANPTVPGVGSFPHWYDGATWDRAKGDSTDGLLVNLGANNDVTVTGTVSISGGTALGQAGTVTALQGTSPWVTHQNNNGTVSVTGTPNVHVTNSGTIAALPGGITGFAEDVGHTTGDVGIQALSVRKNEPAATSGADNDYQPLTTNSVGALWTHVNAGTVGISGTPNVHVTNSGTVSVSNTVTVTANGGTILGQAGTVTALQGSNPWVTHQNNNGTVSVTGTPNVHVTNSATVSVSSIAAGDNNIGNVDVLTLPGGITGFAEDAQHTTGDVGVAAMAVRKNVAAALAGADADYTPLITSSDGSLWTHINAGTVAVSGTPNMHQTNSSTVSVSSIAAGDNNIGNVDVVSLPGGITGFAEDVGHTTGDVGIPAMAVRKNVAAALAGADADYTPLISSADGALWTHINAGTVAVSGTPNVHVTNSGTVSVSNTVTVDTELPAAAALADNTANPTVPGVGAFGHVWDGANWDRTPGNTTAGALVHVTNSGTVSVSGVPNVHVTNNGTVNGGTILGQAGTVTTLQGTSPWVTSGTVIVTGNKTEDAAAADGDAGLPVLAVRNDGGTAFTSATGDYSWLGVDSAGRLGITGHDGIQSVPARVEAIDGLNHLFTTDPRSRRLLEDILEAVQAQTPDAGRFFNRLQDTVSVATDTGVVMDGTRELEPVFTFANVAASQTDQLLVLGSPNQKIRVLLFRLHCGATATNLTFNGKPVGAAGSAVTEQFQLGANSGRADGLSEIGHFETAAGQALTVTTGTGSTVGVGLSYIYV